jgi:hypothetical protein
MWGALPSKFSNDEKLNGYKYLTYDYSGSPALTLPWV